MPKKNGQTRPNTIKNTERQNIPSPYDIWDALDLACNQVSKKYTVFWHLFAQEVKVVLHSERNIEYNTKRISKLTRSYRSAVQRYLFHLTMQCKSIFCAISFVNWIFILLWPPFLSPGWHMCFISKISLALNRSEQTRDIRQI